MNSFHPSLTQGELKVELGENLEKELGMNSDPIIAPFTGLAVEYLESSGDLEPVCREPETETRAWNYLVRTTGRFSSPKMETPSDPPTHVHQTYHEDPASCLPADSPYRRSDSY